MQMIPVTSSSIKAVGHDPETSKMRVQFHTGHTYEYEEVSEEQHADFISADSIGKHFNNHIQGKFQGRRL